MRLRTLDYIPASLISVLNIIFTSASSKLFSAALGEGEPEICLASVVHGIQAVTATAHIPPGTATESLLWLFSRDLDSNRIHI